MFVMFQHFDLYPPPLPWTWIAVVAIGWTAFLFYTLIKDRQPTQHSH